MTRTLLFAAPALAAAALAVAGCQTSEKAAAVSPVAAAGHAVDCNGASLALADDAVVGKLDGKAITFKDLGDEAKNAEKKALYEYCDAVSSSRNTALDNYVTQKLIDKAAAAAGKDSDDWMRAEVQKRVPTPSDDQMRAFYEENKREGMPPFEQIDDKLKSQVSMVMQRDKTQDAMRDILESLNKGVNVERTLPDVRSPPRDVDITTHTATKGTGKVKVVEFADFQCPYCSRAAKEVHKLTEKYGDKIEFAYRNFPLRSIHPFAQHAAEVGQCAFAQGKFWEMSDKMYGDQDKLDDDSLHAAAKDIGLDVAKLDACLSSGQGAKEVQDDVQKAEDLGVEGTPTFFVNGRQHLGAPTAEGLSAAIDAELK